jgi:hypothetical protein
VSAHWALENIYDYYLEKHDRYSYDDADSRLLAYVNRLFFNPDGSTYPDNAAWVGNPLNLSLYGPGDGTYFGPLVSLDVVGHEITHGVTEYSAGLLYANESGALNESFSDIFGTALEFYIEGSSADWLMGEDVGNINNNHFIFRSLENPKLAENPDTYLGQYWIPATDDPKPENDYGGVHTNCGVQSHWFYLLCEGGSGINDNNEEYTVTGIGLDAAEQIAYRNLTVYLTPASGYSDAARFSRQSAIDLYGENSTQHKSVVDSWYAAGVYLGPALMISADTLNFISDVQQADTAEFLLTNKGLDSLKIAEVNLPAEYFQLIDTLSFPIVLAEGESRSLHFVFVPLDETPRTFELIFSSNDTRNPTQRVVLQGNVFTPVSANRIYSSVDQSSQGYLLTIGITDSVKVNSVQKLSRSAINALAVHPSGYLYGISSTVKSSKFLKIDPQSGIIKVLLEIPEADIMAIAFAGDTLFAIGYSDGNLYKMGDTNVPYPIGLAVNPLKTDEIWVSSYDSGKLYIFDRQAVKTWERTCTLGIGPIAFDAGGKLFGFTYTFNPNDTKLALLDTSTAKTPAEIQDQIIGSLGYQFVMNLAVSGNLEVTDINSDLSSNIPDQFILQQNYPNPFNPLTTIEYRLPQSSRVDLSIYNVIGQKVATLVSARQKEGYYKIAWDATGFASGVYFYKLTTDKNFVQTRKMVVLK